MRRRRLRQWWWARRFVRLMDNYPALRQKMPPGAVEQIERNAKWRRTTI